MNHESGTKVRLLMIEDNPGDVELFRYALSHAKLDCDLIVIADGGMALDLFRKESSLAHPDVPDLVILDLNLPKASGREILAEMRAARVFANVPVVVWTSSNSPRDRSQLEALRVDRYVVKPADLGEFFQLGAFIKQLLEECSTKSRGQSSGS
jgi:two-component system, chemotaxis family, response regulator Rcp1